MKMTVDNMRQLNICLYAKQLFFFLPPTLLFWNVWRCSASLRCNSSANLNEFLIQVFRPEIAPRLFTKSQSKAAFVLPVVLLPACCRFVRYLQGSQRGGNMLSPSPLSRLSRKTPAFQPASQPTSQGGINMENKSTQTFSPPLPRLRPGEDDKLGEEIKQELVKWRQRRGWDYLETRPGVLAVLRVTAAASVQRARPPNRTCRAPGRNTDWLPGGPETTRPGWRL